MAYIGQRPVIGRYIKLDQISSGFNGSNTGFSMTAGSQAVFPGTARNLLLSLGGVIQEPDTDFTISGSTLTFTTPPVANTTFFGVIYGDMQATGTPSDGTVLPASIASSGHFKIPQLTVNEDGANVDFRVEGDTEANLLFVDASTNRVGIGTNTPTGILEIDSSATTDQLMFDVAGTNYARIGHNTAGGTALLDIRSEGHARILTNGNNTAVFVNTSQHVGIGTTSPSYRLDLGDGTSGNDPASGYQFRINAYGDYIFALAKQSTPSFSIRNNATSVVHLNTQNSKRLALGVSTGNNSGSIEEHVNIISGGNLGIGTTSPDFPLETVFTNNNSSSFSTSLAMGSGANANLYALHLQNLGTGNSESGLLFSAGNTEYGQWSVNCLKTGSFVGDLAFRTRTGSATSAERMRIASDGRIMINSTAVTNTHDQLTVKRAAASFGEMSLTVDANTTTGSAANAFLFAKSKDTYWAGYGFQNNDGHIGAIVGRRDASASDANTEIRVEIGGTHINQSEDRTWNFKKTGDLSISDGNLIVANNHGIDFSASGGPQGSGSELLDDYEEGTFTPTMSGSSTAGSPTYLHQRGDYTKVGNMVTINVNINVTNIGGGAGNMRIGGLPFTPFSQTEGITVAQWNQLGGGIPSGKANACPILQNPNTYVELRCNDNSGGAHSVLGIQTVSYLRFCMTYFT